MTPLRVHSLHALAYCERLFYLEEVEEMRVAKPTTIANIGHSLGTKLMG